jgi:hypothetical protein
VDWVRKAPSAIRAHRTIPAAAELACERGNCICEQKAFAGSNTAEEIAGKRSAKATEEAGGKT